MEYAGKVYVSDLYIGTVSANSITSLKRVASRLCNRYYKTIDTIVLHRVNGEEVNGLKLQRINRLAPNNTVSRGNWK